MFREKPRRAPVGCCVLLTALSLAALDTAAHAATITVTTTAQSVGGEDRCSLIDAISSANRDDNTAMSNGSIKVTTGCVPGSGADTILLSAGAVYSMTGAFMDSENHIGPTATPIVTSPIVIEGAGARLTRTDKAAAMRAFAVGEGGDLTLREVHVTGFEVNGGRGARGGGGGLGAGGGVYVHRGTLSVERSTFEFNGALGGIGGRMHEPGGDIGGGGGGGLGGNGGLPHYGGGGGGGSRGHGGDSDDFSGVGGGGGGRIADAFEDLPGLPCGGAGGRVDLLTGNHGEAGTCPGGGGGGGSQEASFEGAWSGGAGAYGGGGGGGGRGRGDGALGGFGGGGGGAGREDPEVGDLGGTGGDGGFGGGGGAGFGGRISGEPGVGGTFAGDAGRAAAGGGAALGGAIFGHEATITVRASTFTRNYVVRGTTPDEGDGDNGTDAGGALFLVAGSLTVLDSTIAGNESTGDGAGIVVYRPTTGQAASLELRNSIVWGNTGVRACFLRNGATSVGSGNVMPFDGPFVAPNAQCQGIWNAADPQLEPLALNAPGRTPTMALPLSSPVVDGADASYSLETDQRGIARTAGTGPDPGAYEAKDLPPKTTIMLSPAQPNGAGGWYVGDPVGVTVAATDPDGSVAQTRCSLDQDPAPASFADLLDQECTLPDVGTDGTHTVAAASVDASGNVEPGVVTRTFKLDRSRPVLTPSLSTQTVTVGEAGVTAAANATDATSGVASQGCDAVDTSSPGVRSVECRATDVAGNSTSSTLTYVVEYRILGFFDPAPASKWKTGQTVPVKLALADAGGTRLADADAAALASACRVTYTGSGAQTTGPTCLRYDAARDQFVGSWKLGKRGTGPTSLTATVSYPETSRTTSRSLDITITG